MREPSDMFWDVREREQAEEQALSSQIDSLERAVNVIHRTQALRHATGFADLVQALKGLLGSASQKLENDTRLTDPVLREQRGYVRALNDVIALLTREGQAEHLASQIEQRKNALAAARCRRPQSSREVTT